MTTVARTLRVAALAAAVILVASACSEPARSRPPSPPAKPSDTPPPTVLPLVLPPYSEVPAEMAWSRDGGTLAIGGSTSLTLWNMKTKAPFQRLATPDRVETIGWSPDGSLLLADVWPRWAVLWSTREGFDPYPLLRQEYLRGHTALDPTGRLIAHEVLGADVRLLDARTGAVRGVLAGAAKEGEVRCFGWAPNGKRLAIARGGDDVLVFDVDALKQIAALKVKQPLRLLWSPDADVLVADGDDPVSVFIAPTFERKASIPAGNIDTDIAWNAGGGRIAGTTVSQSGRADAVSIFEVRSGKLLRSIDVGVTSEIGDVALSPDGSLLAVTRRDEPGQLYDAGTGALVATLEDASWPVSWSPDSALFATTGRKTAFAVWTRKGGIHMRIPRGGELRDVAWAKGGAALLVRDAAAGSLDLVDLRGSTSEVAPGARSRVTGFAESPDSKLVAVGRVKDAGGFSLSRSIEIWSPDPWKKDRTLAPAGLHIYFSPHDQSRVIVAFSPDKSLLAGTFGGERPEVSVWETATWTRRGTCPVDAEIRALVFRSDNQQLAVSVPGGRKGDLALIDAQQVAVAEVRKAKQIGPLVFSPGGDRLLWGSARHGFMLDPPPSTIAIWQAPFNDAPVALDALMPSSTLAWSADGALIAAGQQTTGEAILWEVATRTRRELPLQPGGASVGVAFRPGDTMLAASGDHLVLYRPADGAALALYEFPLGDRMVRLVHTDKGLYDGDKDALRFLRLRIGEGVAAAIVSSGPAFEGLRRPGLLRAFLEGQRELVP